jgi:hypothetical protein
MSKFKPRFNELEQQRIQKVIDLLTKKLDESGCIEDGGDPLDLQIDFTSFALQNLHCVLKTNYAKFTIVEA